MTDTTLKAELLEAYKAIFLASQRRDITRDERNARLVALRDTEAGKAFSFEEREVLANQAVEWAADITDEVYFSASGGKWQ